MLVYVIANESCCVYVGTTRDFPRRLHQHNSGLGSDFTRSQGGLWSPLRLVEASSEAAAFVMEADITAALLRRDPLPFIPFVVRAFGPLFHPNHPPELQGLIHLARGFDARPPVILRARARIVSAFDPAPFLEPASSVTAQLRAVLAQRDQRIAAKAEALRALERKRREVEAWLARPLFGPPAPPPPPPPPPTLKQRFFAQRQSLRGSASANSPANVAGDERAWLEHQRALSARLLAALSATRRD